MGGETATSRDESAGHGEVKPGEPLIIRTGKTAEQPGSEAADVSPAASASVSQFNMAVSASAAAPKLRNV